MRVELTIDGGFACFPGLAKPITIDSTQLPAADAADLRRLCGAALAVASDESTSPPATLYDARRYHLAIDIDGVKRDLDAADPVSQPAVADLIAFVTNVSRR
jgi:hypothetical protein